MSGHGIDCHGGTTQRQQQTEHGISTAFPGMDTEELIHARMGLSVSMPCHAVLMPWIAFVAVVAVVAVAAVVGVAVVGVAVVGVAVVGVAVVGVAAVVVDVVVAAAVVVVAVAVTAVAAHNPSSLSNRLRG